MGFAHDDNNDIVLVIPGTTLRFDDMGVANGGVARDTAIGTTYQTLYSYSGSGYLSAFGITFEGNLLGADPFSVRLQIDGTTVLELSTLDIGTSALYNLGIAGVEATMGVSVDSNTFRFYAPHRHFLSYTSSVVVSIKKLTAGTKRFRAGFIYLTKDPV